MTQIKTIIEIYHVVRYTNFHAGKSVSVTKLMYAGLLVTHTCIDVTLHRYRQYSAIGIGKGIDGQ